MDDLTYDQKLRIEALRAASRVMHGSLSHGDEITDGKGGVHTPSTATVFFAKHFYRYLETGE